MRKQRRLTNPNMIRSLKELSEEDNTFFRTIIHKVYKGVPIKRIYNDTN